jgi:hypothetical protein
MIYLEHPQTPIRIPMSKGVEPGTKHDILPNALGNRLAEEVFRHAAANNQQRPQTNGVRPGPMFSNSPRRALEFGSVCP